jgi:hypothetical protein
MKTLRDFATKLGALAFLAGVGCHNEPCHDGFDAGEQFQITVLSSIPSSAACQAPSLSPGDSFTLTAGDPLTSGDCKIRGAQGGPPPFAASVLTSCAEFTRQLGLECTGMTAAGCSVTAQTEVGPYIDRGTNTIEHGTFSIWWLMASSCNTGGCQELYDVRIDRLAATPGG